MILRALGLGMALLITPLVWGGEIDSTKKQFSEDEKVKEFAHKVVVSLNHGSEEEFKELIDPDLVRYYENEDEDLMDEEIKRNVEKKVHVGYSVEMRSIEEFPQVAPQDKRWGIFKFRKMPTHMMMLWHEKAPNQLETVGVFPVLQFDGHWYIVVQEYDPK